MRKTWFAVLGVLVLSACEEAADPGVCPAVLMPSARVTVLDSISGANVTPGSSLVLRNAAVADSVLAPEGSPVTAMGVGRAAWAPSRSRRAGPATRRGSEAT